MKNQPSTYFRVFLFRFQHCLEACLKGFLEICIAWEEIALMISFASPADLLFVLKEASLSCRKIWVACLLILNRKFIVPPLLPSLFVQGLIMCCIVAFAGRLYKAKAVTTKALFLMLEAPNDRLKPILPFEIKSRSFGVVWVAPKALVPEPLAQGLCHS